MPQPALDFDLMEEEDFRAEAVAIARAQCEAIGYPLNERLEALSSRFIRGELTEDEFKFEIIRPYLH
jgi:hypothetical protein